MVSLEESKSTLAHASKSITLHAEELLLSPPGKLMSKVFKKWKQVASKEKLARYAEREQQSEKLAEVY